MIDFAIDLSYSTNKGNTAITVGNQSRPFTDGISSKLTEGMSFRPLRR